MTRMLAASVLCAAALAALVPPRSMAAEARHFSFAYDQPHTTGYGVAGDIFDKKLQELSHGTMAIDQFPGAQLGQEPQALQKIRTGDIDFISDIDGERGDGAAGIGRVLAAFHLPLRGPPEERPGRSRRSRAPSRK